MEEYNNKNQTLRDVPNWILKCYKAQRNALPHNRLWSRRAQFYYTVKYVSIFAFTNNYSSESKLGDLYSYPCNRP